MCDPVTAAIIIGATSVTAAAGYGAYRSKRASNQSYDTRAAVATPASSSEATPVYSGQKHEAPTLTKYQKRLMAAMAYGGSGSTGGLGGYTTTGSSTKTMLGA